MVPCLCMTRRLYSEHVPHAELTAQLMRTLARRHIELAVAVFPNQRDTLHALASRADQVGLELVVWPLLSDEDGRWPNAFNTTAFACHTRALLEGLSPRTLLMDLEPPITWTRALLGGAISLPALRYAPRMRAGSRHQPLLDDVRSQGWRVDAVVPPMLTFGAAWQRWLGTYVAEEYERVEPMAYTSLFQGYSRGLVDRRVACDLLCRIATRSVSVALGVVAGGALGDERGYESVAELIEDVGIARASGVDTLSLYALDGILVRPPIEPWLDAFVHTPPSRRPPSTRRGALLCAGATALGSLGR